MRPLLILLALTLTVFKFDCARAQSPDFSAVTNAVKDLCGAKGTSQDLHISTTADGKVVLPVTSAGAKGSVEFSKSEWDGVEAMRHDSTRYTECVTKMTPLFLERMKTSRAVKGDGTSDSLVQSDFISESDMKKRGCSDAYEVALNSLRQRCAGRLLVTDSRCYRQPDGGTYSYRSRLEGTCEE